MRRSSSVKKQRVKLSQPRIEMLTKLFDLDVKQLVRGEVDSYFMELLQVLAQVLMNTEVLERVGARFERNPERDAVRWGSQPSSAYLLGQLVPIDKPRVRTKNGGSELELETAQLLRDPAALNEQLATKLLSGLSTRKVAGAVEGLLDERGIGRQTISRRGIEAMSKRLEEFQSRSLEGLDLVAILIDGIGIGDTLHVVAIGVEANGKKHVLGMKPGETEDHVVCKELLADLIERGVSELGGYLFVIDGGKGLRKAIRAAYGNRVAVQRCLEHKKRNIESYVPKHRRDEFRQKMNAAFAQETLEDAERAFDLLRRELSVIRASAENSLMEGLSELLTLHRLGVTGALRKTLCTTNCIESVFSTARYYMRNVKRWRKEEDGQRWLAAGLLEAEQRLRPIKGYTRLGKLRESLQKLSSDR